MLPHLFVWLEFAFEMFCGTDVYCALLRCFGLWLLGCLGWACLLLLGVAGCLFVLVSFRRLFCLFVIGVKV